MLSTTDDESDYSINVSNRQKTSGVRFDPATGREFNRFLGSAAAAHEHGYDELIAELTKLKKEALANEPKLNALIAPGI
jgi:sigma54-dependent transcription regulator